MSDTDWIEDWNLDLREQPDEEHLRDLYQRYMDEGDAMLAELPVEEIVTLLRAQRINYRRDIVDRARRAGIIGEEE